MKLRYETIMKKLSIMFASPLILSISFFLYKILVDIIYLLFMGTSVQYGIHFSCLNIFSSYLIVLLYTYFIYKFCNMAKASSIMMIIISMIYFIPITTYCSLGPGSSGTLFWALVFWVILSVLELEFPTITLQTNVNSISNTFYYLLFGSTAGLTIYLSIKYTNGRIITSLENIYEIRSKAAMYDLPTWLSYFQRFSVILISLLILMSFNKKKYVGGLFSIFLLLLNFSFAGHKTVLFMGVLLIIGYFLWIKEMIYLIVPGGVLIAFLGIFEKICFKSFYIVSFFFRRQGYVLAVLSDYYYRFFKINPKDFFRSTFLRKLNFESPYSLPIPYVLGTNYDTQTVSYNNGILADVWAHLGIIGILVLPIILIVCFKLFDLVTDKLDMKYFIGLAAYYSVIFTNTTWSTALLTHGFLIMCIIFFMFPQNKVSDKVK